VTSETSISDAARILVLEDVLEAPSSRPRTRRGSWASSRCTTSPACRTPSSEACKVRDFRRFPRRDC
jgi:hypothetical protein